MVDHFLAAQSQAESSVSPDLLAGLAIALIVTVIILRYMKVILYVAVFVMAAIVFAGIIQVEPLIAQIIANVRSDTESFLGPQPGPAGPEAAPDPGLWLHPPWPSSDPKPGSRAVAFDRG